MFGRFTRRAQKVLLLAQEEARRMNYPFVGTEHILLGLLREGEGVAAKVLSEVGISADAVREQVEQMVEHGQGLLVQEVTLTPRAKRVLELAIDEARRFGHNYVGTEHLLLGLVREGEGIAARVLVASGADLERVRAAVIEALGTGPVGGIGAGGEKAPTKTPALDQYGRDLTRLAREDRLDPVAGDVEEHGRVCSHQVVGENREERGEHAFDVERHAGREPGERD